MSPSTFSPMLAQQMPDLRANWLPVVLLLVIAILFAITNILASVVIGPSRTGKGKETTYESGMVPIGDTHKRFNVRFYVVAMVFLVIDVEIVFFYPFATIFAPYVKLAPAEAQNMLISIFLFVGILLLAYVYAWGKGVFRWD